MDASPIGYIAIRTRTVRSRPRQERLVKVSHHGPRWKRWRSFAQHWWLTNVGPIPDGFLVFHRDGNSLNDEPSNLILAREEWFKLIFARDPSAAERQQRNRSKAVAAANRRRAEIARSQIHPGRWYLALPQSRAIIWLPAKSPADCRSRCAFDLLRAMTLKDLFQVEKNGGRAFSPGDEVVVVSGSDLIRGSSSDGEFEGFIRLIPDTRRAPRHRRRQSA